MFFSRKKESKKQGNDNTDINESVKYLDQFSEVDPIAEADVYLAYGRTKQAMEILNEALEHGKLTQQRYDEFLEKNNLKNKSEVSVLEEALIIKNPDFTYFVSITAGNNEYITRKRLTLTINNPIYTEKGIKEIEKTIDSHVKEMYLKSIEQPTWTLDSYIEIIKEE